MKLLVTLCLGLISLSISAQLADTIIVKAIQGAIAENHLEEAEQEALGLLRRSLPYSKSRFEANLALGVIHLKRGRTESAGPFLEEAQRISDKLFEPRHKRRVDILSFLAVYYYLEGRYVVAESLYLRALELLNNHSAEYPDLLNNLAALYIKMRRYHKAEALLKSALDRFEAEAGKETMDYQRGLNNLATLYDQQQRWVEANELMQSSLRIIRKLKGPLHPLYGEGLQVIADIAASQGKYERAVSYYGLALRVWEKLERPQVHLQAKTLNNLALLHVQASKFEEAEALYLEAQGLLKKRVGSLHPAFIRNLCNLASLEIERDRFDAAQKLLDQAFESNGLSGVTAFDLKRLEERLLQPPRRLMSIGYCLAAMSKLFEAKLQRWPKPAYAERYQLSLRAAQLLHEQIYSVTFNEAEQLPSFLQRRFIVEEGLRSCSYLLGKDSVNRTEQLNIALQLLEYNKARSLSESIRGVSLRELSNLPDSLLQAERALQQQQSMLKKAALRAEHPDSLAVLQQAQARAYERLVELKAYLQEAYPRYYQLQYASTRLDLAQLQAKLGPQELYLSYFIGESAAYVFYATNEEAHLLRLDMNRGELLHGLARFRLLLSDYAKISRERARDLERFKTESYALYQALLQPVLERVEVRHLHLVPDTYLAGLSFACLLTTEAKAATDYATLPYLLRDYQISYHYSGQLMQLLEQQPKQTHNGKLLAIAPDYEKLDSSLRPQNVGVNYLRSLLQPLPGAQLELSSLAQQYAGSFWKGKEASEQHFKEEAGNYGLLHLAMHGLHNRYTPIHSCLAFTTTENGPEDDFLQASEIARLNLKADLVVLSACQTGYEQYFENEGVLSLSSSFIYAGVPSLLVSFWPVNDEATGELMMHFYRYLEQGYTKPLALQRAQLDYLQEAKGLKAQPAFWAPFVQVGNTQPVQLLRKEKNGMYYWIGGGLVLFLAGVFWRMKLSKKAVVG